jgi:hypothetical protein
MKKYFTGIVVLLLVIIGVIIIMKNKNTKTKTITQPQNISQTEQTSSTSNYESHPVSTFPTTSQIDYKAIAEAEFKKQENQKEQADTSNQQNLPPQYTQLIGECNKTVDDIIKDYRKVWGEVKPERNEKGQLKETFAFTKEENENFLKIFLKYARCEGIANRNKEKCYFFLKNAGILEKSKNVCDKDDIPDLFFIATLYDKTTSTNVKIKACKDYFSSLNSGDDLIKKIFSNVSENQFCESAKDGIHNLCNNLLKGNLIKSKDLENCKKLFPENPSDCDRESDLCFTSIAMMNNSINYCQTDECRWLVQKDCNDIKSQVILTYCNSYRRVEAAKQTYEQNEKMKQKELEYQKKLKGGKNAEEKE